MRKLLRHIRRSLSVRLSLWVVAFSAVIFLTTFSIIFNETHDVVQAEAWGKATKMLDGTVLHIDNTLDKVEVASDNMLRVIEQNLDKPDMMYNLSRQVLESNPDLSGCSISFEPDYYKEKGKYFSAYSYNNGDSIQTENEGNEGYQFHYMDWYLIPTMLNRPYWIEPFMEDADWGIVVKDIFSSYSRPIHDKQGNIVGTFSLDICLDWFSKTVSDVKPFPNSYAIMLGKGGTYIVHPDTTRLFYETIFTQTLERPDSAVTALGRAMMAGQSGHKVLTIDDQLCHVFYKPFKNTGWSVAIICPESDFMYGYNSLKTVMLWISVGGLVVLSVFCWYFVGYRLRPLRRLARMTHTIAEGQFDNEMQVSRRSDEIGQLQRSFQTMQQSLGSYIQEVRQQTTTLEERNAQLLEAYEHAKEDERIKTTVLHNMPEKIVTQVTALVQLSRTISQEYRQMDTGELDATVKEIQADTTQVTNMLDELMATVQRDTPKKHVEPHKPTQPHE